MAIQNFFTSRDNNLDGNTYVGQLGRLWYNPDTNSVYASDGVTPGGIPVDLATGANAVFNIITANSGAIVGNLTIGGNISPAAVGKIGGITPGPGANVSNTGLLTIDTTGLPLSFGNFTANNNILTIVNSDEDMVLATSGDAEIQLVGNVGFYRTNGLPPDPNNRYFRATDDGQIQILVPNADPLLGAVEIVGSASEQSVAPNVAGTMLHVTGQPGDSSSIYNDGIANTAAYVSRRYNGNALAPTQVLSGQGVMVIAAQGYGATSFGSRGTGAITFTALEDFTDTAQGMQINFQTAAIGNATRTTIATINSANGVTATRFVTAGTVEATGNISGGNLILSSGGIISSSGLIYTTANVEASNVLATGAITSNSKTAGIGYRSGAGNVVTQNNSKSDPVTINAVTGEITMNAAQLGGDGTVSFTMTNSAIANTDVIILNQVSDANIGLYSFNGKCNSGNAVISVHNMTNNNRSDAIVIRFAVIKGALS